MINESFLAGFIVGVVVTALAFFVFGLGFAVIRPWIRLKMTGGRGSLLQIVAMRLRGTPPMMIVDAYTSLLHSGEDVRLMEVESAYVAHRSEIMDARSDGICPQREAAEVTVAQAGRQVDTLDGQSRNQAIGIKLISTVKSSCCDVLTDSRVKICPGCGRCSGCRKKRGDSSHDSRSSCQLPWCRRLAQSGR